MFIKPEVVNALNEFGDANLYGSGTITKELYDELIDIALENVEKQIENSEFKVENIEETAKFIENITPHYGILYDQIKSFYNQNVSGGLNDFTEDQMSSEIFSGWSLILLVVIIVIIIILVVIFPMGRKNNRIGLLI